MKKLFLISLLLIPMAVSNVYAAGKTVRNVSPDELKEFCEAVSSHLCTRANTVHPLKVDAVRYYRNNTVEIYFSSALGEQPLRKNDIDWLYVTARSMLSEKFPKCSFKIFSDKKEVEKLASVWFSTKTYTPGIWNSPEAAKILKDYSKNYEKARKKKTLTDGSFIVRNSSSGADTVQVGYKGRSSGMASSSTAAGNSRQWVRVSREKNEQVTRGLQDRNIALWDSHGYYFNNNTGKWGWQRPHLFRTLEDKLTPELALHWLVPMLENAGAYVVLPRERDTNTDEMTVDYGRAGFTETGAGWTDAPYSGFGGGKQKYGGGENPFAMGRARQVKVGDARGDSFVSWEPEWPKAGEYAVYVSYQSLPKSTTAVYTVHHCGQSSRFFVNQRMGGSTWVYLGTFFFDGEKGEGKNPRNGVSLTNARVTGIEYKGDEVITADAVRFGGGMGNVTRGEAGRQASVSGMPRYLEGARYWMQWAGFPENLYSPLDGTSDYKDDYTCRAVWVNALSGGSEKNPYRSGYGVPLDLSLALHTDAGLAYNDSIVGTLAIYTSRSNGRSYLADGRDRMINRELCDIVQSQVVEDLRAVMDSSWSRRGMWDQSYLESRVPEVPSMLLELLSHQNLADAALAAEPEFRFTVCRAIYKGILKFFKATEGRDYVVQPLPVTSFSAVLDASGKVRLNWKGRQDPLEPSAAPDGYVIYRRVVDVSSATDAQLRRPDRYYTFERIGYTKSIEYTPSEIPEPGKIYSYMVKAVNRGGCSFPGEILSVAAGGGERALVVNAFDRLGGGECFGLRDTLQGGFSYWADRGVPYRDDIAFAGEQYSFDKHDPYVDDAHPGFGASWNDYDSHIACGNTFDYPLIHGAALCRAGYGFSSCSRTALEGVDMRSFSLVDVISGKQRTAGKYRGALSCDMTDRLSEYLDDGGNLLISGAYVLSDVSFHRDEQSLWFAEHYLKCRALPQGCSINSVMAATGDRRLYSFMNEPNADIYSVEQTDVLTPLDRHASVVLRYGGHGPGAAVLFREGHYNCMVCGFPVEVADDASGLMGHLLECMKQ